MITTGRINKATGTDGEEEEAAHNDALLRLLKFGSCFKLSARRVAVGMRPVEHSPARPGTHHCERNSLFSIGLTVSRASPSNY